LHEPVGNADSGRVLCLKRRRPLANVLGLHSLTFPRQSLGLRAAPIADATRVAPNKPPHRRLASAEDGDRAQGRFSRVRREVLEG
jgi:hypothetical protein